MGFHFRVRAVRAGPGRGVLEEEASDQRAYGNAQVVAQAGEGKGPGAAGYEECGRDHLCRDHEPFAAPAVGELSSIEFDHGDDENGMERPGNSSVDAEKASRQSAEGGDSLWGFRFRGIPVHRSPGFPHVVRFSAILLGFFR